MIDAFTSANDISRQEIADLLGITRQGVGLKVRGERPWKSDEINTLLAFLTKRLGREVTYEEVFLGDAA
jgi:transcriptional regulator with XRE-family HTH domain